jgi:hypothetical protein
MGEEKEEEEFVLASEVWVCKCKVWCEKEKGDGRLLEQKLHWCTRCDVAQSTISFCSSPSALINSLSLSSIGNSLHPDNHGGRQRQNRMGQHNWNSVRF